MAQYRGRNAALVGKRVCWLGMGFSLLTHGRNIGQGNTLWRPTGGKICGEVVDVQPRRFYQNQEDVAWLRVKLDKAKGRFKFAQAYFDEKTGRMLPLTHERAVLLPPKRKKR